ncbi:efflux RND transporter periplasmic adaptor subunit [Wenzhouxiangella sp. XN79A]|uniref:efflux RND transporter periplasmic adaptor subunit n=1 Tax=Wenzhouxiangella sp. XN79A TaxID=2724193 RepID=UPI00144A66AE|nr:efflux RND transporter periplasmic adaptor subunit [Wenzhouxiangella sp. XN79A]NKI34269.1 efflux RND transporter periplasmic adaptor subunit [Wenzhouxiangella sp. XN79A]
MTRIDRRTLFGALAAAFLLSGCSEPSDSPTAPGARPVGVIEVAAADRPVTFDYAGRTASSQRVEIRPRITGYLDSIEYTEGGFVDRGDVLFRIDPKPFESRLRGARAELSQQQARLDNAEALLARVEPLVEARAVAQKEADDARALVAQSAAAVEAASARVFEAELELGYATITAPVTGIAGAARFRQGALVGGTAEPLTEVARIDPVWVEFSIAEGALLAARHGTETHRIELPTDGAFDVRLTLADGTPHPDTGRISFADAQISERTGTLLLRAEVPNPDARLRPGQFVTVHLDGALRPDAIAVPQAAVQQGPRGPFVWVVDGGSKAERRPVRVGPWDGRAWIVHEGLFDGDRVIVEGVVGLSPGTPVQPRPTDLAAAD